MHDDLIRSTQTQRAGRWRDALNTEEPPMSPDQMKRQTRRLVHEVWTKGDFTVAGELGPHDDADPAQHVPGGPA